MTESTLPGTEPGGDPGNAPDPPEEPSAKALRLSRRPSNTNGTYMVLCSAIDHGEPMGFVELGWYRANDDDHAKRQAAKDAANGHQPELADLLHGDGCYLRAVPARSWPKAERSGMDRPPPRLQIG